jgi:GDP-D-mannose dehydratase
MTRSALVVGVSGIVGNNLAQHLLRQDWEVSGLSRRPYKALEGLLSIAADLLETCQEATLIELSR